jgi:hypothetical protein
MKLKEFLLLVVQMRQQENELPQNHLRLFSHKEFYLQVAVK